MGKRHPILHDFGPHYRTPRQIIDALHDAGREMDYSNYHNGLFAKAEKIIRAWCKAEGVPIGPTRATLSRRYDEKQARDFDRRWGPALDRAGVPRLAAEPPERPLSPIEPPMKPNSTTPEPS
jgi:hypothetical protein